MNDKWTVIKSHIVPYTNSTVAVRGADPLIKCDTASSCFMLRLSHVYSCTDRTVIGSFHLISIFPKDTSTCRLPKTQRQFQTSDLLLLRHCPLVFFDYPKFL